jgi:hypothetical protein
MPSPTPPPPLPDPEDDRRLAERRARAAASRSSASRSPSSPSPATHGRRSTPPPPPRPPTRWARLSPRTWAIVVAVAIVAVVILVGTLISRGSSDETTAIKTDAAVSTLQSLLDGVDRDTALGACPFGSVRSIAADVGDRVPISPAPIDAEAMIVKGDQSAVDEVLCSAGTPDDRLRTGRTLYVYATPVPKGSYTDYLSTTLLDGAKVKLEDPRKYANGTIYAWCVTPSEAFKAGCGADWVANESSVVFGMQVAGGEITAADVSAALEHELPSMVERFGTDVPTSSVPATGVVGSAPSTDDSTG